MHKLVNYIIWVSIISGLIAWSGWTWYGKEWFEIGQASTCFGLSLAFIVSKKELLSARILFALTSNQLMDELFFNPFSVSWNEYITVCVVILLILYNFYKHKSTQHT